jgi:Leucine-rich repeat (LRR) protein
VGAFCVAGIGGVVCDVEGHGLPDRNLTMTQPTPIPITNTRIVNNDNLNAIPLEGFLLKFSMRCKIILAISLLLLTAIIILVVISLLRSSNATSDVLAEKLKPFLTAIIRTELEVDLLATSLAFDWLLNDSRFNNYSFEHQIQQFALAQFFSTTKGESWSQSSGWLTEIYVCSWYQTYNTSACVDGTLQVLSLVRNNLTGQISNDIGLISTLEVLDLSSNSLLGSIPSEVGALTTLTYLDLYENNFTGSIPSVFCHQICNCSDVKAVEYSHS